MVKISLHHRTIYCYLGMILWIFFLLTAMYRYIAYGEDSKPIKKISFKPQEMSKTDVKYQKIYTQVCNPPKDIARGSEGLVDSDTWLMQGALAVVRHGDRAPLTHLRKGDKLPCDRVPRNPLLKGYTDFVVNGSASGRAWWVAGPGPFHNFPSLPAKSDSTRCALGQLTPTGLLQMITVGNIFRLAYAEKLGLDKAELKSKNSGDFVTYSTRYRRTFTSMAGVWWGFVRNAAGSKLAAAKEAHSIMFCFRDCACPAVNKLHSRIAVKNKKRLESRPAVKEIIKKMSKVLFEAQEHIDASIVWDAILAYMCHHVTLPCTTQHLTDVQHEQLRLQEIKNFQSGKIRIRPIRSLLEVDIDTLNMELEYINSQVNFNNEVGRKARDIVGRDDYKQKAPLDFDAQMEKEKLQYYQQKYLDNSDGYDDVVVIKRNLDADFNFQNDAKIDADFEDYKEATLKTHDDFCVRKEHVLSLNSYLDWSFKQQVKHVYNRQIAVLTAYGLIRNIVQNMIKMISENKPKFVLYSGHDKTLQALCLALGLYEYEHYKIQYASRLIFEVYRKKELLDEFKFTKRKAVAQDFYFRVVFNGVDVTNKLSFCKPELNIAMEVADPVDELKVHNTYLCPIENIVRFIHDDYFAMFNASNFKDACAKYGTSN